MEKPKKTMNIIWNHALEECARVTRVTVGLRLDQQVSFTHIFTSHIFPMGNKLLDRESCESWDLRDVFICFEQTQSLKSLGSWMGWWWLRPLNSTRMSNLTTNGSRGARKRRAHAMCTYELPLAKCKAMCFWCSSGLILNNYFLFWSFNGIH